MLFSTIILFLVTGYANAEPKPNPNETVKLIEEANKLCTRGTTNACNPVYTGDVITGSITDNLELQRITIKDVNGEDQPISVIAIDKL